MNNMFQPRKIMIVFLSVYRGGEEEEYSTDRGFKVLGRQTNEAPVRYAVKRLSESNDKLDKIIALTTPSAYETAWDMFNSTVKEISPGTEIVKVDIDEGFSATEILNLTLEKLELILPNDRFIVETTGGYRTAVNVITLLLQVLKYYGAKVSFSTYSDFQKKYVSDTRETDELSGLIDAVNIFAETGNVKNMKKIMDDWKSEEKKNFFKDADRFYDSLLICRTQDIIALKESVDRLLRIKFDAEDPKTLVFIRLVMNIVDEKMDFLRSKDKYLMLDFIMWCADNRYLQQAVTLMKEAVVRENEDRKISYKNFHVLRMLRNTLNHAQNDDKREIDPENEFQIKVENLMERPNEIRGFIEKLITQYKKKSMTKEQE